METYLSLDLGGTKLLIGEVDAEGHILNSRRYPSGYLNQEEATAILLQCTDDYLQARPADAPRPKAIGIGLVGRSDPYTGTWLQIDPKRTHPVALARLMEERYGLPCQIDNDVKSAAQAEMRWGHGQASRHFVYLNVGTGIAAATVTDGRLLRGNCFNAGEVGHTTVGLTVGTTCACGRHDCVETIASGSGLDACARLLADRYASRLTIPEQGRVSAQDILQLADEGDPLCTVLADNAAEALAQLIMNLVRLSDPDTVILGGGVVADGRLLGRVKPRLQDETMRFVSGGVKLTALNAHHAGLLGAAAVAMRAPSSV